MSAADAMTDLPAASVTGTHHIGMTVADLDAALRFWESFLGKPARWRKLLDKPYLGRHVGYPGVSIDAAFVDLPGGGVVELLDYQVENRSSLPDATANPGNVHLCLTVADCDATWNRAVACGAKPIVKEGPVEVSDGPNKGARVAYLRIHDGITLEFLQPPPTTGG